MASKSPKSGLDRPRLAEVIDEPAEDPPIEMRSPGKMVAGKDGKKYQIRRTLCPLTLAEFLEYAKGLPITMAGQARIAGPRKFAKGSFGWYLNDKGVVVIGDREIKVQINLNITVVGSKDAARQ